MISLLGDAHHHLRVVALLCHLNYLVSALPCPSPHISLYCGLCRPKLDYVANFRHAPRLEQICQGCRRAPGTARINDPAITSANTTLHLNRVEFPLASLKGINASSVPDSCPALRVHTLRRRGLRTWPDSSSSALGTPMSPVVFHCRHLPVESIYLLTILVCLVIRHV